MDVLKDEQKKEYDFVSRYTSFPFYYNTQDDKYIYGITSYLSENVIFVEHKLKQWDTLDSLAFYYYGRPDLYWVIADFNRIQDPFINLFENYKSLKIPQLTGISFIIRG